MGVVFGFTFGLLDVEDEEVLQRPEDLRFEHTNMQDSCKIMQTVFCFVFSCFLFSSDYAGVPYAGCAHEGSSCPRMSYTDPMFWIL
jgi:hypothetical protein